MGKSIIQAAQVTQPVQQTVCLAHDNPLIEVEIDLKARKLVTCAGIFNSRIVDPGAGQGRWEIERVKRPLRLLPVL